MAASERAELEGEVQPLLQRRVSLRDEQRWRFEQAQRQAVGGVAMSSRGLLARFLQGMIIILLLGVSCFYLYVYFGSLWVIVFHLDKPCDQPLGPWLVGWMIMPMLPALFDPPLPRDLGEADQLQHARRRHWRQIVLHCTCFSLGYTWLQACKTCQQTNHFLYEWVHFVIYIYVGVVVLLFLAPLLLTVGCLLALRLVELLIDNGWISNPNAASEEAINSLQVVTYDPMLFSVEKNVDEECCCCTERFGYDRPIVRTGCGHYYHQECLVEWLKLAKSCPLCRCDLDAAAAGKAARASIGVSVLDVEQGASRQVSQFGGTTRAVTDEELARRLQEEEIRAAGASMA